MSTPFATAPDAWAVVLAAGAGTRLSAALAAAGGPERKQYLDLEGAPLFWKSACMLSHLAQVRGLVFVFPAEDVRRLVGIVAGLDAETPLGVPCRFCAGGTRRQDSVRLGLAQVPAGCPLVLVHDAARPFASAELCGRVFEALNAGAQAAVPGIPVNDTIKRLDKAGGVAETPPRAALRAVQTPQGFALGPLRSAHVRAEAEGWEVTDDAMLMERAGGRVVVVAGEEENVKITTPADLALLRSRSAAATPPAPKPSDADPFGAGSFGSGPFGAQSAGAQPSGPKAPGPRDLGMRVPRTGWGYDVHRYLEPGAKAADARPMVLGGVAIPEGPRVLAHSDGDVLLHALTDALLGIACAGDIGRLFPDDDPATAGAPSPLFVAEALRRVRAAGYRPVHADLTVIAQIPRLGPHRDAVTGSIAGLLGLPAANVNVKATTEEGLGFTGEKRGIKAVAVVTAAPA